MAKIPSASQYVWVTNANDLDITGRILPVVEAAGKPSVGFARAEDAAFLYEFAKDRSQGFNTEKVEVNKVKAFYTIVQAVQQCQNLANFKKGATFQLPSELSTSSTIGLEFLCPETVVANKPTGWYYKYQGTVLSLGTNNLDFVRDVYDYFMNMGVVRVNDSFSTGRKITPKVWTTPLPKAIGGRGTSKEIDWSGTYQLQVGESSGSLAYYRQYSDYFGEGAWYWSGDNFITSFAFQSYGNAGSITLNTPANMKSVFAICLVSANGKYKPVKVDLTGAGKTWTLDCTQFSRSMLEGLVEETGTRIYGSAEEIPDEGYNNDVKGTAHVSVGRSSFYGEVDMKCDLEGIGWHWTPKS